MRDLAGLQRNAATYNIGARGLRMLTSAGLRGMIFLRRLFHVVLL